MSDNVEKKPITFELIKIIFYVASLIISIMIFYGAVDKRITMIETEMKYKVDDNKLFEKLDQLEFKIGQKIEIEIAKIKTKR